MFKTYLDSVKAKLSDLFYLHGKVCATHPLVVLSLVFTINNTCSAPAICAFFFNPSSIDRFLDFGGSAVPAKAGIVFSPTSNVIGIDQIIIETSLHDALKSVDVLDPGTFVLSHILFQACKFRFSTEVILLSVGRFKLVKSKFWLGFAAVLIFNLSLLMAFGICLFFDLEIAFIPWKVVPFFIIAIGSENVLRITQAVASTSLDLPVRERIGEAAPQDADQSLFLASIWESMLDQIGKLKSYSSFKFTMVGLSLFSAVFISKQLRQTAVFSYSQGLELSGMEFPYTSQLDDKFWKLLNPSSNELYLEIRPAKRLTLTWLPSKDVIAGLSQPFKTFLPHKKVVQKPTLQTLLLLLATGGCITIYLNILSKGRRNEKARWQNLDPRKSICVFKGFWADVVILESNGQELVAALSLAGELVVWNHHINRVIWQGSKDGSNLRISSLAVSTHGWLVCGYVNGSVDFFCFEPSYRGSEPSTLLFQGESAAPVSRILFLPQNQNLIAILAGGQLFIYHLIQQKVIYSSNISSKVACVYGLPQIVFAGLATGEVLVISLNEEEDRTQLSTDAISTASSLPITYLDALETDGRFRVLLIGFQNSDCEVQLLSDTNDLKRHLLLPSLDTGVKAIIGLQLLTSPDGFIATISSPTTSYIIHLSQHNIISPTSPRNLSFKITYSATVPSVGCPFTFTQGETLIGLSRVSRHWELWGIRLSHGSLQGAIQNRLRFSLACDPLANEGSDLPEDSNSDKSYPWVPFGFVSLPFVPLSKSQGLGMALGNYVFCINPHLLLSSQDD
ncbi:hypothetical protein L0F63_002371 [Massospora cicadina]|nr:hypothetical protein L0F63_002371 [Massospora cicadina]